MTVWDEKIQASGSGILRQESLKVGRISWGSDAVTLALFYILSKAIAMDLHERNNTELSRHTSDPV